MFVLLFYNLYHCVSQVLDEQGIPITQHISQEYYDLLQAVLKSPFYTSDPGKACLFLPSYDVLNQNHIRPQEVSRALAALPYWRGGVNHVIFSMVMGSPPEYKPFLEVGLGQAILAGAGFSSLVYRPDFDVSIPVYSSFASLTVADTSEHDRPWKVIFSQLNVHPEYKGMVSGVAALHPELLVLDACQKPNVTTRCKNGQNYAYPSVLKEGDFCLVVRGARLGQTVLMDAMASGCIPIVVADSYVLPFDDIIDWKRSAIILYEDSLDSLWEVVSAVSQKRLLDMRTQARAIYSRYMSSMEKIALTTLEIIQGRIYPHEARTYDAWNSLTGPLPPQNPLLLPMGPPKSQGFTALVLTYDRWDSLVLLLKRLAKAPSLSKVLVVWNNQNKVPPPASAWPGLPKPLKVIRSKDNKLSNRFFPYPEIETEAVLALDDDIVMLTTDELEFGFEVWREHPDRIVGFPSRTHIWDNGTFQWKYESEWTNHLSMVLTGAAFYHKYWSYLYTTAMPGDIKEYVDEHMNCEDIAMNFLVANRTGKAPIKVTPRKKFKCPECRQTEMLSADLGHMQERTRCINKFTELYGARYSFKQAINRRKSSSCSKSKLRSTEIRDAFVSYFVRNDHVYVKSSPVLPYNDPSLHFVNAGMNQFKPVLLGNISSPYRRVVNSQKCIRVGGKHNDLNDVGRDGYHHTFFEMLGNWSFGDYFKAEACQLAWELLTKEYGIPSSKLFVSYFEGDETIGLPPDEECFEIWRSLGYYYSVLPSHILPFGVRENFWEMGLTGPCGPCTEIHFDRSGNPASARQLVNAGSEEVIEIWNLVFMQYNKLASGDLVRLPAQHVDTGMGLERITAVLSGVKSNYDTDLFQPLLRAISQRSKTTYGGQLDDDMDVNYRILADHARMITVALADGMFPDSSHRLRKVLRSALSISRHQFQQRSQLLIDLAHIFEEDLFFDLQSKSSTEWNQITQKYPALSVLDCQETPGLVSAVKDIEGLLSPKMAKNANLDGDLAFKLYDTYVVFVSFCKMRRCNPNCILPGICPAGKRIGLTV
nr:EOG090X01LY [Lepidurus arcticus]